MQDFRKLKVWGKAHDLTLDVYRVTQSFPRNEHSGLTSQIRRAAVSISANIAEGCGREGRRELARFLQMAMASATELEYHMLLAKDLGLVTEGRHALLASALKEVKRMLASLIQTVRAKASTVVRG